LGGDASFFTILQFLMILICFSYAWILIIGDADDFILHEFPVFDDFDLLFQNMNP
jgi:hypothetical protein